MTDRSNMTNVCCAGPVTLRRYLDRPDATPEGLKALQAPVLRGAADLAAFGAANPELLLAPFVQYKQNLADLMRSTSGMHMNWLWPNLCYLPTNIPAGDSAGLRAFYRQAIAMPQVIFVNHTMPHKSNAVMRAMFGDRIGDYLKRRGDTFVIADGNGPAFVRLVRELAAPDKLDFSKDTFVVVGVGGAGTLAAHALWRQGAERMILVDPQDRSMLARKVGALYCRDIGEVPRPEGRLVVIDATTHHEQGLPHAAALPLVERFDAPGNLLIDYNMHTDRAAYAHLHGRAAVGADYVAVTNYLMVREMEDAARTAGVALPLISRAEFDAKVAESLLLRDRIALL